MWLTSGLTGLKCLAGRSPRALRCGGTSHSHSAARRQSFRPQVEYLEGRTLLNGTVWHVTSDADNLQPGTLRYFLDNKAQDGDTITIGYDGLFGGGDNIHLSLGPLHIAHSVEIKSFGCGFNGYGAGIDGNHASEVFDVYSGVTATLTDLSIYNGQSKGNGGGIYDLGRLKLNNCEIRNNSAQNGGGIYDNGRLDMAGCSIHHNSAHDGGGIYSQPTLAALNGMPNLPPFELWTGCTISFNTTTMPTGVYDQYGGDGGGIFTGGGVYMESCTLNSNLAAQSGGGIRNIGQLWLANSTVGYNQAFSNGGGICNSGILLVNNGTIAWNQVGNTGGGICTIASNYSSAAPITIIGNTIVAHNFIGFFGQGSGADIYAAVWSLGNNLIFNKAGASGFVASDLLNVDPQLGTFNGLTFPLNPGSPALAKGNVALAVDWQFQPLKTDGYGYPRYRNHTVDIGASEWNGDSYSP
jgi:hypothetical protein